MKLVSVLQVPLLIVLYLFVLGCRDIPRTNIIPSSYLFIQPEYTDIYLSQQKDSVDFDLDEDTYNQIRSINYFNKGNDEFISFYDARSQSVNIYNFDSKQLIKRIELKKWLPDPHLKFTSVSVQNFDSIFIANIGKLYLFDSAGVMKKDIQCLGGVNAIITVNYSNPLIVNGNTVYTGVKANVDELSSKSISGWRALYSLNLEDHSQKLLYQLPDMYQEHILGERFMRSGYCFNNKGNFVISFSADTNIYETNLADYHAAYFGKSQYQSGDISPVPEIELKMKNGFKQFTIRDSYGPIYYDPYKKRYLRVARQKISAELYETNKWQRQSSFIIFDEKFKIIGESKFPADLSYSSIFFTPDGGIYSQVNSNDEYALHFVRLAYDERKDSLLANK